MCNRLPIEVQIVATEVFHSSSITQRSPCLSEDYAIFERLRLHRQIHCTEQRDIKLRHHGKDGTDGLETSSLRSSSVCANIGAVT